MHGVKGIIEAGSKLARSVLAEMTHAFVTEIGWFVATQHSLITFEKGVRKEDIAARHLARFTGREGILFIGKAQEKTRVFRTPPAPQSADREAVPLAVPLHGDGHQYYLYLVEKRSGPCSSRFRPTSLTGRASA